jgi:hypothetical protein
MLIAHTKIVTTWFNQANTLVANCLALATEAVITVLGNEADNGFGLLD